MKTAIIVNPYSGGSRTGSMWKLIGDEVRSRLGGLEEFVTAKPMDATRFATQIAQSDFEFLIIAGGDGTINEAINGLFDENNNPLNPGLKIGILSAGRGCDLIRSLNIPPDYREAMDILVNPTFRKMDLGVVYFKDEFGRDQRRIFHNIGCAGLAGLVARKVNHTPKLVPASLAYFGSVATSFLTSEGFFMKVKVDGKEVFDGRLMNLFVCNGGYSGAGMCWAPMAKTDDGIFEIIVGEPVPKHKIIFSGHRLYDGTIINMPGMHHHQGREVTIETQDDVYLELDGEQPGLAPAVFKILPGAISIAAPV